MPMHDSQLISLIAEDGVLGQRIAGVITKAREANQVSATEAKLLEGLDPRQMGRAVAGNPTIFGKVKAAMTGGEEQLPVSEAVQAGVVDSDLEYVVLSELTFLQ